MRKIEISLVTGILWLAACGGGNGLGDGGAGDSSGCKLSCLVTMANLTSSCQPSGTCTEQAIGTTSASACYSNGIKMSVSMATSSSDLMSMSIGVKKNGTPCFSMAVSDAASGDTTVIFKNASGTTVATVVTGGSSGTTVTCPGGSPSGIDTACNADYTAANSATSWNTGNCSPGTCAY